MVSHMHVARREVLVQLDDDLVQRLDELAADQKTSRSELIRRAVVAVLEVERTEEDDRRLQEAYLQQPPDPAVLLSARRLAAETAPEW